MENWILLKFLYVWRIKYTRTDTKTKIYRETVRPIMTYALETRAET